MEVDDGVAEQFAGAELEDERADERFGARAVDSDGAERGEVDEVLAAVALAERHEAGEPDERAVIGWRQASRAGQVPHPSVVAAPPRARRDRPWSIPADRQHRLVVLDADHDRRPARLGSKMRQGRGDPLDGDQIGRRRPTPRAAARWPRRPSTATRRPPSGRVDDAATAPTVRWPTRPRRPRRAPTAAVTTTAALASTALIGGDGTSRNGGGWRPSATGSVDDAGWRLDGGSVGDAASRRTAVPHRLVGGARSAAGGASTGGASDARPVGGGVVDGGAGREPAGGSPCRSGCCWDRRAGCSRRRGGRAARRRSRTSASRMSHNVSP